ncbi:hypothetical protein B0T24DRAFT_129991 [Lasiosphaeria ovina]|uniref:Uncharacterized protein n=1 Tax=Lasiosphaeria ovina TaxID=92902 RepID=A0AAE0JRG4_9PEZI|nr:hypothetical protein B0T24DRAFT_129991 [Lasiosphaeria ovina]
MSVFLPTLLRLTIFGRPIPLCTSFLPKQKWHGSENTAYLVRWNGRFLWSAADQEASISSRRHSKEALVVPSPFPVAKPTSLHPRGNLGCSRGRLPLLRKALWCGVNWPSGTDVDMFAGQSHQNSKQALRWPAAVPELRIARVDSASA